MEDPLVARDTDKVRFYLASPGEGWRDVYPADYRPADELTIAREQKERQRIHEVARSLETVCVVCDAEIPAHYPDYLITTEDGRKGLVHIGCISEAPAGNWKLRHCQGGIEVEEQ